MIGLLRSGNQYSYSTDGKTRFKSNSTFYSVKFFKESCWGSFPIGPNATLIIPEEML